MPTVAFPPVWVDRSRRNSAPVFQRVAQPLNPSGQLQKRQRSHVAPRAAERRPSGNVEVISVAIHGSRRAGPNVNVVSDAHVDDGLARRRDFRKTDAQTLKHIHGIRGEHRGNTRPTILEPVNRVQQQSAIRCKVLSRAVVCREKHGGQIFISQSFDDSPCNRLRFVSNGPARGNLPSSNTMTIRRFPAISLVTTSRDKERIQVVEGLAGGTATSLTTATSISRPPSMTTKSRPVRPETGRRCSSTTVTSS